MKKNDNWKWIMPQRTNWETPPSLWQRFCQWLRKMMKGGGG